MNITPPLIALLPCLVAFAAAAAEDPAPPVFAEVRITSAADGSRQPARWYAPSATAEPVPLLVMLHSWNGDYKQRGLSDEALVECANRGWALIHPHFRGPNKNPKACASPEAVQDVLDAIAFAQSQARIDKKRIHLLGTSGGGHMSLMMACKAPHLFAGVSAWVPPTDLAVWHRETARGGHTYARDLEAITGGKPGQSKAIDAQYHARSPLFHLHLARGVNIDINVGIHDGHTGSIPISHSLNAFNRLAQVNQQPAKRLTESQQDHMIKQRTIPQSLAKETEKDDTRKKPVLFRRTAGPVRLTIFNGTHEGDTKAAIHWLSQQSLP